MERKDAPSPLELEIKGLKTDVLAKLDEQKTQQDAMQRQLDAIDSKSQVRHGGIVTKSLSDSLKENESLQRLMHDKRGTAIITLSGDEAAAVMERKTAVTNTIVGAQTTGVLQIDRDSGIVTEARQTLTMRDVLSSRPTTHALIDFVKVVTPMAIASPQTEGAVKAENAVTFTSVKEDVRTIATWIPASRQVLDDMSELAEFLGTTLRYYLDLAEELQILSADGSGQFLHGLIPQATSFNTSLLSASAGWNKIDVIGRAIEQLGIAKEISPTFVVLNPRDWGDMRLLKNSLGEYLLGDPQTAVAASLFNRKVVETTSITAGTFLLGNGSAVACELRDRMEVQYEISTSHDDYFTRNLVACRAERRVALVTKRPGAFVTGSFTTSP